MILEQNPKVTLCLKNQYIITVAKFFCTVYDQRSGRPTNDEGYAWLQLSIPLQSLLVDQLLCDVIVGGCGLIARVTVVPPNNLEPLSSQLLLNLVG